MRTNIYAIMQNKCNQHLILGLHPPDMLGPYIAPYDYKEVNSQLMLSAPSAEHWFGTDHLGQDMFT